MYMHLKFILMRSCFVLNYAASVVYYLQSDTDRL